MTSNPFEVDPTDYAKYVLIEDLVSGAYVDQKVRIYGKVVLNDHQSKKITLEHNDRRIECILPDNHMDIQEQQMYQMIGKVLQTSSTPILSVTHVRFMNFIEDGIYDTAVQRFNEFVFQ